jgi:hypothetical protein
MVGNMSMGLDLEILLKFPNVAREPGSFIIYFFFTLFFFSSFSHHTFLLYIYIFFHHFLFFPSFFTPLELDYTGTSLATPHA